LPTTQIPRRHQQFSPHRHKLHKIPLLPLLLLQLRRKKRNLFSLPRKIQPFRNNRTEKQ
jgi:hypothetical protein